ncbi:MAG: DUF5712 family protein [Sedimentibacter sp.]|uniref:DUF5712 family protein n=1 Tax=Sedimentibacter sp. TaxID=1960295 RepID=UPI0029821AD9|nr:DUF5712 family protein [Sedimentibacter sp.]MDW5299085.1 DUF5712 family protein [Sedimentibacter sp.]
MYVKIHSSKKDNNRGSCRDLINYLEKENLEKDALSQEKFFDQNSSDVSFCSAQASIDNNKGKLGKDETKFYMISVNPSKDELKHIGRKVSGRDIKNISQLTAIELKRYEEALKDYTRKVMDDYAKNFNRGLTGESLVYFGKVEHTRYHGRDSVEVKEGLYKAGDKKEGLQTHVHIVVSRIDQTKKIRLSPMANAKNSKNIINGKEVQIGFDRMKFVQSCEKSFDTNFDYKRSQQHKFSHYHTMKNQMRNTAKNVAMSIARDVPGVKEYNKASRVVNTTVKLVNAKDPLDALSAVFKQVPGAKECIKAINYAYNPSKIALDIGKKVLTIGLNAGSL